MSKTYLILFVIFLNTIICLSRFSIVKENKQALEFNISTVKYEYYDLFESISISFLSKQKCNVQVYKSNNSTGYYLEYLNFFNKNYAKTTSVYYNVGGLNSKSTLNNVSAYNQDYWIGVGIHGYGRNNKNLEVYSSLYFDKVVPEISKNYNYFDLYLGLVLSRDNFSFQTFIRRIFYEEYEDSRGIGLRISYKFIL